MSALGVGDQVVVNARRAWRRGRIWKIDGKGALYVGVRIPTSGEIKSLRVAREDAHHAGFVPTDEPPSLATPAPDLLEILKAIR